MKSVLNALQEGRLIELPDNDREKSLQYLASIIEAMPDFLSGFDYVAAVAAREKAANTAIGGGWACPHGRVPGEGELACAIGWSPGGIGWDAPDRRPVHIVCMHYIPDSEKNIYLKEISTLARVITKDARMRAFDAEKDLGGVRNRMIDLLSAAVESAMPDAKARMIQLEAKQAAAVAQILPAELLASMQIVPLTVVVVPGSRAAVLSRDASLTTQLEAAGDLAPLLAAGMPFERAGYRIIVYSVRTFSADRIMYDCLAIRAGEQKAAASP